MAVNDRIPVPSFFMFSCSQSRFSRIFPFQKYRNYRKNRNHRGLVRVSGVARSWRQTVLFVLFVLFGLFVVSARLRRAARRDELSVFPDYGRINIMNPDKAFSLVQMAAEKERLPHAYLLTGDPRERGWPLAAKIAGFLLCPEAQAPCGSCDTCRRIANRSHPDVLALEPEKKSRIISIEAMRETFLPWTSRQSFEGGWKVGIIVFADRLNDASANAFLKTLEEPPPRTLFLMLTDKPDALLPTIRSRCQCLDLSEGRVPPAEPWRTRVGQIMAQHANGTQLRVRATTARLQAMFDEISEIATTQTEEQAKALSGDPTAPAIDGDTLQRNGRDTKQKMAALRFWDLKSDCPTNAGILMFGLNPLFFLPGAYIQYIRFEGEEMTDAVGFEKRFSGALISELKNIDDFVKDNIIKEKVVRQGSFQEARVKNYPYWALRELVMNAIMHRSYESNSPIYIYEFTDRIEIINPGGLYGDVTPSNFPYASDYRNVVIAEALKSLGYVNKFNYGVQNARAELERNGNGEPVFDLTLVTKFKVTIPIQQLWKP